jgi:hypothetical protein
MVKRFFWLVDLTKLTLLIVLIEPFTCADFILGLATFVQIFQQLTPQLANLLQIPKRIRMSSQKPILTIHQTTYQPELIMA